MALMTAVLVQRDLRFGISNLLNPLSLLLLQFFDPLFHVLQLGGFVQVLPLLQQLR